MTFMNAKMARPVEDASALVAFGWAPGGSHCAACATCGEAHGGSDKRSLRCQDCAEALRDKPPAEPAAKEDWPLGVLIATKNALYSGGAQDPTFDDARLVLAALRPAVVRPLVWRKPTTLDRDNGHAESMLIAPGLGGVYSIQPDLENFICWRVDDPFAFDTFPTLEAAKAHAEADWQRAWRMGPPA